MKTLRMAPMVVLLMMLLAAPALADGTGLEDVKLLGARVKLNCASNPETVTIRNVGTARLMVERISTLINPDDKETFDVNTVVEPGETIIYQSGSGAPEGEDTTLTQSELFDEEMPDDGLRIVLGHVEEPTLATGHSTTCAQGGFGIWEIYDSATPPSVPNTGAGGAAGGLGAAAGYVVAALSMLGAFGYAARRRR